MSKSPQTSRPRKNLPTRARRRERSERFPPLQVPHEERVSNEEEGGKERRVASSGRDSCP
jgi:hypothetical protein